MLLAQRFLGRDVVLLDHSLTSRAKPLRPCSPVEGKSHVERWDRVASGTRLSRPSADREAGPTDVEAPLEAGPGGQARRERDGRFGGTRYGRLPMQSARTNGIGGFPGLTTIPPSTPAGTRPSGTGPSFTWPHSLHSAVIMAPVMRPIVSPNRVRCSQSGRFLLPLTETSRQRSHRRHGGRRGPRSEGRTASRPDRLCLGRTRIPRAPFLALQSAMSASSSQRSPRAWSARSNGSRGCPEMGPRR